MKKRSKISKGIGTALVATFMATNGSNYIVYGAINDNNRKTIKTAIENYSKSIKVQNNKQSSIKNNTKKEDNGENNNIKNGDGNKEESNSILSCSIKDIKTGTGPFDNNTSDKEFEPGKDFSESDEYVRTNDTVTYNVEIGLSNKNTTEIVKKDLEVIAKLPEGNNAIWESNDGNTKITNRGKTLTMNLKGVTNSSAHMISLVAKVSMKASNGTTFKPKVVVKGKDLDEVEIKDIKDIKVSAVPMVDLAQNSTYNKISQGGYLLGPKENGEDGEPGQVIYETIELTLKSKRGAEDLKNPITFTCDISKLKGELDGVRLYTWGPLKNGVGRNGDNSIIIGTLPYGSNPSYIKDYRYVSTNGDITAKQSKPGENIDVTINNLDISNGRFPKNNWNNTSIEESKNYIFSGYIALWVPNSAFKDNKDKEFNVTYTDLKADGISGTPNNINGEEKDTDNNTVKFIINKREEGEATTNCRLDFVNSVEKNTKLNTMTNYGSRDGIVYPNQEFGLQCQIDNVNSRDVKDPETIVTFNPNELKIKNIKDTNKAYKVIVSEGDLKKDNILVQYGVGNYNSLDEEMKDLGKDTTWYDSLDEAEKHGKVCKVKITHRDGEFKNNTRYVVDLNVEANGNLPCGTKIPAFIKMRAKDVKSLENTYPSYNLDNLKDMTYSDVVTMSYLKVAVKNKINKIKGEFLDSNIFNGKDEAELSIIPTLTSKVSNKDNSKKYNYEIITTLPNGLTYDGPLDKNSAPKDIINNLDGSTILKWDLKNISINEAQNPIKVKVHVDFNVLKDLTVKSVISNEFDLREEKFRTSFSNIKVVNTIAWDIYNDKGETVEENKPFIYTSHYGVLKKTDKGKVTVIDILPYNGDSKGSKFNGNYTLENIKVNNNEKVYLTEDNIENLDYNFLNNLKWEEYNGKDVRGKNYKAIKIVKDKDYGEIFTNEYSITLMPEGNKKGDVYSLTSVGCTDFITTPIRGNNSIMKVVAASIGDRIWYDSNKDGKEENEEGISNIEVRLLDENKKPIKTVKTDKDGRYKFDNLYGGKYFIEVNKDSFNKDKTLKESYSLGNPVSNIVEVILNKGQDRDDVDFGYYYEDTEIKPNIKPESNPEVKPEQKPKEKPNTKPEEEPKPDINPDEKPIKYNSLIGDRVWYDANKDGRQGNENGISGIKVNLLDKNKKLIKTEITNENGIYKFENLKADQYFVEVDEKSFDGKLKKGETLERTYSIDSNHSNIIKVNLKEDTHKYNVDFGYCYENAEIKPDVKPEEKPEEKSDSDVKPEPKPEEKPDSDVKPEPKPEEKPDSDVKPEPKQEEKPEPTPVERPNITYSSIGDKVWYDSNKDGIEDENTEKGISGIKVNLLDKNKNKIKETITDKEGKYNFEKLKPDEYYVEVNLKSFDNYLTYGKELKQSYSLGETPSNIVLVKLKGDKKRNDVDFGYYYENPINTKPSSDSDVKSEPTEEEKPKSEVKPDLKPVKKTKSEINPNIKSNKDKEDIKPISISEVDSKEKPVNSLVTKPKEKMNSPVISLQDESTKVTQPKSKKESSQRSQLPKTGGVPIESPSGLISLITGLFLMLKRKKK